jgi:hypothetical protein
MRPTKSLKPAAPKLLPLAQEKYSPHETLGLAFTPPSTVHTSTLEDGDVLTETAFKRLRPAKIRVQKLLIEKIVDAVCRYYATSVTDYRELWLGVMAEGRGKERISRTRHMAIAVVALTTTQSYVQIGRVIGGRDHSTIMHSFCTYTKRRVLGTPKERDVVYERELRHLIGQMAKLDLVVPSDTATIA